MSNPLDILTNEERTEYSSLKLRNEQLNKVDSDRYTALLRKMGFGGKSRRNPSQKRPTARRRRSSKARKARATRRK
jgi:hypothetical protein